MFTRFSVSYTHLSVLTVSGFFKQGATDTAADKMMKVLEAEAATQKTAI